MKVNGKLQMAFGPVGDKIVVDNASNTNLVVGGIDPFVADIQGYETFDKWGDWVIPQFEIGQELILTVPSGYFRGLVVQVTHRDDVPGAENLVTVEGQWNGAQGGATGGLSGLGSFSITEVTSVEGTFGEASSLEEYNQKAQGYRSLYYSLIETPNGGLEYKLTPMGEGEIRKYLKTLDLGKFNVPELTDRIRKEISCEANGKSISFRSFRQWLDLRYSINMEEEILLSNTYMASPAVAPNAPPVNSMEFVLQSIGV